MRMLFRCFARTAPAGRHSERRASAGEEGTKDDDRSNEYRSMRMLLSCFVGWEPSAAAAGSESGGDEKKAVRRLRSATARLRSLSLDELSRALASSGLHAFTQAELSAATRGLSGANFLGEGGFGPVYKGFLDKRVRPGEVEPQHVAVKFLDVELGTQGHREWLAEVVYLGMLRHPHLVKLIGYGCQDEQRMLVYEYMARGSLEHHLFNNRLSTLPWYTRLKIAVGAAKGLAFLHEADTPVIYRDFKASNILLDSDYTAKLSDFGLAKEGPQGDDTHVTTRVMGTPGYAAPEYILTGHLTAKCDVYSFGVVLLELLSGRRSVDERRRGREQNLVDWARPYLRNPERLHRVMDPSLDGQYSAKAAHKAAMVAYHCLHSVPKLRPTMRDVVDALEPLLAVCSDVPAGSFVYTVPPESDDNGKAADEEAAAAAAKNKCLRSAMHPVTWRRNVVRSKSGIEDGTALGKDEAAGQQGSNIGKGLFRELELPAPLLSDSGAGCCSDGVRGHVRPRSPTGGDRGYQGGDEDGDKKPAKVLAAMADEIAGAEMDAL